MMARRKIEVQEPAGCLTSSRSVDTLMNPISLEKSKGPIVVITAVIYIRSFAIPYTIGCQKLQLH
jgi:hypothetical protein